jgi:two-component system sensor histidine kinase VicK
VYSSDGKVLLANHARKELLGADSPSLDEAVARSTPQREDGSPMPHEELPGVRALNGETVAGERIRLKGIDGRSHVMLANASPLRGSTGDVVAAAVVFHDITEISDLERGRRDLFSMASHDLRTPLTAIVGYVQLARKQIARDPNRALRSLDDIEKQSVRMIRLIRDLLDVTRFESGAIPIAPASADLGERVLAAVERQGAEDRVSVELPASSVRARFDADRIDQVLDNLLSNALRHTAAGTRVRVAVTLDDDRALVRVTDRGEGVSPDERARLFTPFYQTPRGRTYGGTGLGLHISRRIAEAHGGDLRLEESGSSGSTFTLSLPVEGRP